MLTSDLRARDVFVAHAPFPAYGACELPAFPELALPVRRTTALLCRARFHILTKQRGRETPLLAEDCFLLGFTGAPEKAEWLAPDVAEALLLLSPDGNVLPDLAKNTLRQVLSGLEALRPRVDDAAREKAEALLEAHTRVRQTVRTKGVSHRVEPQFPVDFLGVYVFLPKA